MHKELFQRFLFIFSIHIYSEDRFPDWPGKLYKHFVTVYFLGFRVFHTIWKTGSSGTTPHDSSFYLKGKYRNDYPLADKKHRTLQSQFQISKKI